ncbi:sensor domain-containing diguanylate cyclase [Ectothiorhodospira lacustris]|uniref:sensor domain-containing diguanylate cyclase n=1 Tax=Ectothiorhodospira lacustris TaxID=2899127 RepID=UPI001EE90CDC|nr:sensor domain-containing diguanylate cyclase [Ectothiorhodospira lacustris]MCG5511337.1 diguanylate cyclase [Ectothiorhodospira lacustris]MCG5523123.1 diguanylate cyclase [Ectothiorhodospira lacustris]
MTLKRYIILLLGSGLLLLLAIQWWLTYQAAEAMSLRLQTRLAEEVSSQVHDKVRQFFEVPRQVVSLNVALIRQGVIDPRDPEALIRNFLLQLEQQPVLTFLSTGTPEGEYFAASRPPLGEDRSLRILQASIDNHRVMSLYRVDKRNLPGELIDAGNDHYDARLRPWFMTAQTMGRMSWYPAYRYAINDPAGDYSAMGLGISAPLYGADEQFVGVISADLSIVQLSRWLTEVMERSGGVAFITEPDGKLLANSTPDPVYFLNRDETRRISLWESDSPLLRELGELLERQADPGQGRVLHQIEDERYLVDWVSYSLQDGPTLRIVQAIPQSQFMAPMLDLLRQLLLVAAGILLLGMMLITLISIWVTRPLVALSRWAIRLGRGDWTFRLDIRTPVVEVSQLSLALGQMARRLEQQTHGLEQQVATRTAELEQANRELSRLSRTDALTGLANRRSFDEVLAREWGRTRRFAQPLSLLMLDIDWFKAYNDHHGHVAGDHCIQVLADVLRQHTQRASDLAARYGGEEFVIICGGLDHAEALGLAEDIRDMLEQKALPHENSPLQVITVSIGVATLGQREACSPEELIKAADLALYRAKASGRNRVVSSPEHLST